MGTKAPPKKQYSEKEWNHGLRCTAINIAAAMCKEGASVADMLRGAELVEAFLNGEGAPVDNIARITEKVQ